MRALLLVLLVVFFTSVGHAQPLRKKPSGFEKVLKSMFQPRKAVKSKIKSKPKTIIKIVRVEAKKLPPKMIGVDYQWMAHYWEMEMAWDYWIPEDDQINFKDGKYIVPIVVFKHYEDMVNTARRPSAANTTPAISPFE